MKIKFLSSKLAAISADVLVFPTTEADKTPGKKKSAKKALLSKSTLSEFSLLKIDKAELNILNKTIKEFSYHGKAGKRLDIHLGGNYRLPLIHLFGVSAYTDKKLDEWRRLGGAACHTAKKNNASKLAIFLYSVKKEELENIIQAVVEGVKLANYSYDVYRRKKNSTSSKKLFPKELILILSHKPSKSLISSIKIAETISDGVNLARDLVNCPPNNLLPKDLVKTAKKISSRPGSRLKLKVFGKTALKKMRANALLAVANGSTSEPFMLHLNYQPKRKIRNRLKIALVGKGITFDSGGLSIKPGKSMEDMKCDMAGAAAVLATMQIISRLTSLAPLEHEVHAIVPTCENLISGASVRPGDVVRALNGKTIEILNTDAEGRLILADALSYLHQLKPDVIIDIATLTGACIVALGPKYAGLFSNNEHLTKLLKEESAKSGELLWQLPLASEYRKMIESKVADIKNTAPGGPGATTAALFLQEFVPEKTPWVHLDIAGPAFVTEGSDYSIPGGTGFGVRTLYRALNTIELIIK